MLIFENMYMVCNNNKYTCELFKKKLLILFKLLKRKVVIKGKNRLNFNIWYNLIFFQG